MQKDAFANATVLANTSS